MISIVAFNIQQILIHGPNDNIEVFISLDTTGSIGVTQSGYEYDTNCIQLQFTRGIDSVQWSGRASQEEYIYYWENTGDGWLVEVAIPWTAVLSTGQLPEDILDYFGEISGFDLLGSDSDTPGPDHRDCQTAWDEDLPDGTANEDNAWTDRSVLGVMTFGWGYYCPEESNEMLANETLLTYPNPAGNTLHFNINGLSTINIYSISGVRLMEVETTGEVDISNLKSGIYLAEWDKGFVKFIKE